MPLDPCRLLPGRRHPSLDQVLGALAEAGDRGASSAQVARKVGLPVDRVRRVLKAAQAEGSAELRWIGDPESGEPRWFRSTRG